MFRFTASAANVAPHGRTTRPDQSLNGASNSVELEKLLRLLLRQIQHGGTLPFGTLGAGATSQFEQTRGDQQQMQQLPRPREIIDKNAASIGTLG